MLEAIGKKRRHSSCSMSDEFDRKVKGPGSCNQTKSKKIRRSSVIEHPSENPEEDRDSGTDDDENDSEWMQDDSRVDLPAFVADINCLSAELLLLLFKHVRLCGRQVDLRAITLVSRKWYILGIEELYSAPLLTSLLSYQLFLRVIQSSPRNASLVQNLDLSHIHRHLLNSSSSLQASVASYNSNAILNVHSTIGIHPTINLAFASNNNHTNLGSAGSNDHPNTGSTSNSGNVMQSVINPGSHSNINGAGDASTITFQSLVAEASHEPDSSLDNETIATSVSVSSSAHSTSPFSQIAAAAPKNSNAPIQSQASLPLEAITDDAGIGRSIKNLLSSATRITSLRLSRQTETVMNQVWKALGDLNMLTKLSIVDCAGNVNSVIVSAAASGSWKRLVELDLGGTNVSDQGALALAQSSPRLKKLSLSCCEHLTDKGVIEIAKSCTDLRWIALFQSRRNSSLTEACVQSLIQNCHYLEHVDIGNENMVVKPDTLLSLSYSSPNLTTLLLGNRIGMTQAIMKTILKVCPNLAVIDMSSTKLSEGELILKEAMGAPSMSIARVTVTEPDGATWVFVEILPNLPKSWIRGKHGWYLRESTNHSALIDKSLGSYWMGIHVC